jgi:hypothetical protein
MTISMRELAGCGFGLGAPVRQARQAPRLDPAAAMDDLEYLTLNAPRVNPLEIAKRVLAMRSLVSRLQDSGARRDLARRLVRVERLIGAAVASPKITAAMSGMGDDGNRWLAAYSGDPIASLAACIRAFMCSPNAICCPMSQEVVELMPPPPPQEQQEDQSTVVVVQPPPQPPPQPPRLPPPFDPPPLIEDPRPRRLPPPWIEPPPHVQPPLPPVVAVRDPWMSPVTPGTAVAVPSPSGFVSVPVTGVRPGGAGYTPAGLVASPAARAYARQARSGEVRSGGGGGGGQAVLAGLRGLACQLASCKTVARSRRNGR